MKTWLKAAALGAAATAVGTALYQSSQPEQAQVNPWNLQHHPVAMELGNNNAPAGYITMEPGFAETYRLANRQNLYDTNVWTASSSLHDDFFIHAMDPKQIDLFNETIAKNPEAYPIEYVLQSIGLNIGFAKDAAVIPLLSHQFPHTQLTPIHTDDFSPSEMVRHLPTRYNFDKHLNLTTIVFTHAYAKNPDRSSRHPPTMIIKGDRQKTGFAEQDDIVHPPQSKKPVITYFRDDRMHTAPIEGRENAYLNAGSIMIAEPYHTPEGTINVYLSESQARKQFQEAYNAIMQSITELESFCEAASKLVGQPVGTMLKFINKYRHHRETYLFSNYEDKQLAWHFYGLFEDPRVVHLFKQYPAASVLHQHGTLLADTNAEVVAALNRASNIVAQQISNGHMHRPASSS